MAKDQTTTSEDVEQSADRLPAGWAWATFGELAPFSQNGAGTRRSVDGTPTIVIRLADVINGTLSFDEVRKIALPDNEIEKYRLAPGDLLCIRVNGSRNLVGRMILFKEPGETVAFCDHFMRFRPAGSGVLSAYLSNFFDTEVARKYVTLGLVCSAGQNTISQGTIAAMPVPLPPTGEQVRIVAEIEKQFSRLDAGTIALKRVQTNLRRYRASVLKAACEGRLVPQDPSDEPASELLKRILAERRAKWEADLLANDKDPKKAQYVEPQAPNIDAFPQLPLGWCWGTVERLAAHIANSITDGPFGSNLKTAHYTSSGPRVIRLQNVGDGVFVDEWAHISYEHFAALKKHQVFAGDVVIAALGSSLPRACIIPGYVGDAIVKADCIRFQPHSALANARYLNSALNSDVVRKLASKVVHGVGRPRLNLQDIKCLPVPLPPLAEQQRIVDEVERRLSVVDELEAIVKHNLKRADRLRQSILKRAFEGKLVPQDPTDEPADVLLERIRAQRPSAPPRVNKRKNSTQLRLQLTVEEVSR